MLNSEFVHFMRTTFKKCNYFAYLIIVSEIEKYIVEKNLPSENCTRNI